MYGINNQKITLGLTGVILKEDIANTINLKHYLEKETKLNIEIRFIKSYSEMKTSITNGDVDIAYICGATYIDLKSTNQINLLVLPILNGKPSYESIIITQTNSPYNSLFSLKNKIFAISDKESNSASLVPQYMIYKQGLNYESFFKRIIITYDHGESIDAVLSGYVDAASVDSVVYKAFINKNPKKSKKLKVINRFGMYPIPPFVIRTSVDNKIKEKLVKAFINMNSDNLGKVILKSMAIDGFILPKNISYEKIKKIKNYLKLRNNHNVK
ncbi:Periplasmic binding protein-related protein [hydrothermal vent metagenome]|uniref:Periplasmic binding protein-related protein n=1 Tax=hydrothermal vent metagenome TaxID=652676 RepID=A0A3B1E4Y0_9ZZZZ